MKRTIKVTNKMPPGWPKTAPSGQAVMLNYVVGQDNLTGKTISSDGSQGLTKGLTDGQPRVLQSVVVSRSKASGNGRRVSMKSSSRKTVTISTSTVLTQGAIGQPEVDLCKSNSFTNRPPPEDPEDPEPPPPPVPPGPNAPEPPETPDPPPETPEGCSTESDCQWYNSGDGEDTSCPAGTTYKGFAQLNSGFKVLCCGPDRPVGDGCPEDPSTYGYQCVNGTCEVVPNGLYSTRAECESAGCGQDTPELPDPDPRYSCLNGSCVENSKGEFESLSACESGCTGGSEPEEPFDYGPYGMVRIFWKNRFGRAATPPEGRCVRGYRVDSDGLYIRATNGIWGELRPSTPAVNTYQQGSLRVMSVGTCT